MDLIRLVGYLMVLAVVAWTVLHLVLPRPSGRSAVVAHRGAAGQAPENTLAGLRAGVESGARFIEFDIRRTADGHFVLMHDASIDRTTNGSGLVRQSTLAELQMLDASSWFDPAFAGGPVPSLVQAFDLLAGWPGAIVIEVKDPTPEDTTAFLAAIAGLPAGKAQLVSFDHDWLSQVRSRAPDLGIGQLSFYPAELPTRQQADRIGVYWLAVVLDPTLVARAKRRGLELWIWTADHPLLQRWLTWKGVDGITTNYPDRSRRNLAGPAGEPR